MKDYLPKHAKCYFSSPDSPTPRNLTTELQQTLAGQQATAGGFYGLESQYQPLYGQLGLDNQAQNMYGFDDADGRHHPGSLELQRSGTQYQRAGDISDVAQFGPASTAAFLNANPYLAGALNEVYGRMGNSDILTTLNSQANAGLNSGGQLSAQEERAADQTSRSAFSDRGTLFGNQSIGSELLNRDAMVRARQQQAQQFAAGVQGLNQQQNDFTGRAAQIFGTQLSDPFQAILGRSSGAGGGGNGNQQMIGTGARLFNPTDPYAADIYNSNFNAQAANNIASANAQNAGTSTAITAGTSLLAGLLSDKRVKKNIKDTGEKTKDGIPIKTSRYRTDKKNRLFRGVMAQDVEKVRPDAVTTDWLSGLKRVRYDMIDAPLQEVKGKGRKAKYFDLLKGEFAEAA